MDMIPGKTNISWIEARDAGSYRGQCAEYCGLEHAHMGFVVKAVAPAAFADWLNAERRPAAQHSGDRGQDLFVRNCAACHSVRGIGAGGIYGPDLTHFAAARDDRRRAVAQHPGQPRRAGWRQRSSSSPAR